MASIILSQNKIVLIDDEDFEKINQYKWCYLGNYNSFTHTGYAVRTSYKPKKETVYLHKFIINPLPGFQVDHINGDGLDCRKENLRIATAAQNGLNRRKSVRNKTGFKGVYRKIGKFVAVIGFGGYQKHIGMFSTAIEAALAYDNAARLNHGEFAALNFPDATEVRC